MRLRIDSTVVGDLVDLLFVRTNLSNRVLGRALEAFDQIWHDIEEDDL